MKYWGLRLITGVSWCGLQLLSDYSLTVGYAQAAWRSASNQNQSQLQNCPSNIEALTELLIRDIPSYANRINQSARRLGRKSETLSYVILAGRPEFIPLTLGPGQYTPANPTVIAEEPQQLFFTTLERQYTDNDVAELQQYHWLFLTKTPTGWYLTALFSRIGSYPAGKPPSPPRESSNGIIGQAIRIWLRDCRAGSVKAL